VKTYRTSAVSTRCRWGVATLERPHRTCSGDLSITVTGRYGQIVVEVGGELDLRTSGELRTVLIDLAADGHGHVVVDLAGVTFCDAAGLGALVAGNNRFAERGGMLRLVGARPAQRKILHVTRLDELFPVYETIDEAARS
jgi:anti-sigma B factor antagonist